MAKELAEILEDLKRKGVSGSAIVDREGGIIESDLPSKAHEETFGIMCATMMGASNSANSELERGSVKRIIVDSKEGKIILSSPGKDVIFSVIVDSSKRLGALFEEINKAVESIKESI